MLGVLPRGGLGDMLYHSLFAKYLKDRRPDIEPVLIAPGYASFLAELLDVQHWPACSVLTDASAGFQLDSELAFWHTLWKLRGDPKVRGNSLASFTNDVVDHSLARIFDLELFDNGRLGNWLFPFQGDIRLLSRSGVNRMLAYHANDVLLNPKHIVDRQQHALRQTGEAVNLAEAYRKIWLRAISPMIKVGVGASAVLIFPETAQARKNLTLEQVTLLVRYLRPDYQIRIFTRQPDRYCPLGVETIGFSDRWEPLRQICTAAAVISADTFAAHLAGISGTPTYVICNAAERALNCEYWGSPFRNVLNFQDGSSYRLDDDFRACRSEGTSLCFRAALEASKESKRDLSRAGYSALLTGSAARS